MEKAAADAAYARLHDDAKWHDGTFTSWVENQSATHPYRFDFGVEIGVSETDLRPHDKFTTIPSASPFAAPEPEEVSGGDTS